MSKQKSNFGLWVGALVTILFVVFIIIIATKPEGSNVNADLLKIRESDWVKGNPDGTLEIIEYSDFECPACRAYNQIIDQLFRDFGDQIIFVYRHFPLPKHENALLAARAAESAGKQGKFWEMHDLLFEHQEDWAEETNVQDIFLEYASQLNLDLEAFKLDIESDEVRSKIESNQQEAMNSNFNGTPTIFINGHEIQNVKTYDDLRDLVVEYGGVSEQSEPQYKVKSATSS